MAKHVDAMLILLSEPGADDRRRAQAKHRELWGPTADRMTYYERWMHSVAQTMIQRGVVSLDELGRKIAEVEGRADVSA